MKNYEAWGELYLEAQNEVEIQQRRWSMLLVLLPCLRRGIDAAVNV